MIKRNVEIQDHQGDVYYPHTSADVVFGKNGENVEQQISDLSANIKECFQSVSNKSIEMEATITGMRGKVSKVNNIPTLTEINKGIKTIPQGKGNAVPSNVLSGRTFTNSDGIEYAGAMPNRGEQSAILSTNGQKIAILNGYHNGSGNIMANISNLIPSNIIQGKVVGGVKGNATFDANAIASDIVCGKTAYVNGNKITGINDIYGGKQLVANAINNKIGTILNSNSSFDDYVWHINNGLEKKIDVITLFFKMIAAYRGCLTELFYFFPKSNYMTETETLWGSQYAIVGGDPQYCESNAKTVFSGLYESGYGKLYLLQEPGEYVKLRGISRYDYASRQDIINLMTL